jgi:hypothetical protein
MKSMTIFWRASYMSYHNVPKLQLCEWQFDKEHLMSHMRWGVNRLRDRQRQCQMNDGGVEVISKTRPINACIHAPFLFGSRRQPQVSEPRASRRWCYHGNARNAELKYDLSEGRSRRDGMDDVETVI